MRSNEFITEAIKQRLDAKCWKGKHKEGTKIKGGVRVNNCVPNEGVAEGFSDVVKGIKRKVAGKEDPKDVEHTYGRIARSAIKHKTPDQAEKDIKRWEKVNKVVNKEGVAEGLSLDEQFDIIEEMVEHLAEAHGVHADTIWEDFDSVDDNELYETAAWRRKEGKNKKGGLNAKGVASYRRENPGSKLQTAVTTKPSKLKPGSKAAKRRKSFCARMGGMKGPMKKDGKPTRKALALRKWNC